MSEGFAEFDHSGDIGIDAWGRDTAELIENATYGLLGLFCRGPVEPVMERPLRVESSSMEDLLVDWLAEVIAAVGTHGELYGEVEVTRAGENFAEGILRGEAADPQRHDLRFDVKAVTYHALTVERVQSGFHGHVIFDL